MSGLPAANGPATIWRACWRGQYREVLPEWLAALAQAGRRVREEDLRALLEQGRSQRELREAIVAVIGRRGRWLAAQNPDWSYATGRENPEGDWQTASREWRLDELKRCRVSDPARARELVASTWDQETPADRAAFLETFAIGLSMDDEPFLESALDDKRAEVRRAAAELLSRLAESRLCRRMIARVEPLVQFSEHKGKLQVDINLPDEYTKDMARDGIAKVAAGLGEKNAWLSQMLAIVPPSSWCRLSGRSAADLLAAAGRSEWSQTLTGAWVHAAESALPARTGSRPSSPSTECKASRRSPACRWSSRVSRRLRQEELLADLLRSAPGALANPIELFQSLSLPWGMELSHAVVDFVKGEMNSRTRPAQLAGRPDPPAGGLVACRPRTRKWSRRSSRSQLDRLGPSSVPGGQRVAGPAPFPPRDASGVTAMTMTAILREHAEQQFAEELAELKKADDRAAAAELAALSLGGRHLPPGRDARRRLRGLAQVHRQPPADGDRHRHPGHRSGPAAAGRAGHGQELGLGASRGGDLGRLDAADPGHGRHQRGIDPLRLELRPAARRRAVAPGPGAQPAHGGDAARARSPASRS